MAPRNAHGPQRFCDVANPTRFRVESLNNFSLAWLHRAHNLAAAMSLHAIHQAIWYFSPVLQTILLWGLTSRKLYREYPFFYLYTLSHIARSLLAYFIRQDSNSAYVDFYWITEAYFAVLCLAVVQEVYKASFANLPRLRRFFLLVFQIATVVLVIACFVSGYLSPGTDQARVVAAFVVLQRSLDLLVGGLSFALLAALRVIGAFLANEICWNCLGLCGELRHRLRCRVRSLVG